MLKFEGLAVGDRIRAQDFEPRPGVRGDCFVEGTIDQVVPAGNADFPFSHYRIQCTRDVWCDADVATSRSRVGQPVFVPMESSLDWDSRVTKIGPLQGN
jgi:hypothetical protein